MGIKEACANENQHIIIDIPEDLEPDLNSSCWIHRVPRKIRQLQEEAYTPQLISVGPFHYGNPKLKSMEHHKTKYHDQFWKRDFCKHIEVDDIKDFTEDGDRRERIRRSYAGTFGDACFIFELFWRNYEISKYDKDYILKTPWLRKAVEQDLIMLENQLPFFDFTERFDFVLLKKPQNGKEVDMNNSPPYPSHLCEESERHNFFLKITCAFFVDYYSHGKLQDEEMQSRQENQTFHRFGQTIPLSKQKVEDDTECIMRNIMALEQRVYTFETYICNYVSFLDQLINTAEDVELLVEKKMVHNLLGSNDAVTDLINKLCDQIVETSFCYGGICQELNEHYENFWNVTKVTLKSVYFKDLRTKLKIPQLKVDDNTECIFRNVMALEQFVYPKAPRICSYIFLLDQLIDTVEDVDLLVDKRIVENWLGSNRAVVNLVNKLNDQIVIPRFFYADICDKLNNYHKERLNVARSTLNRVYFKDIWTGSSTVVGLVLVVFSFFSTYSTIKNLFFV
nr:uncharacterized protein LOC125420253 [Ziziphus jujuba var. spinosa]